MRPSPTTILTTELIKKASVTPHDYGCQDLLAKRLLALGFSIEKLKFGEVDNLWARYGQKHPLLVFAGHTDVVPSGPLNHWHTDPFKPEIKDGLLYGRGAADMKGSLAAMVVACEQFIKNHNSCNGSIGFLITSDEEGPAINGTVKVVELLQARQEYITWCIVGEPTSQDAIGDTIKNGRRGSLNGFLIIKGTQGHVAYPDRANNPIHRALPVLAQLLQLKWDNGNNYFPATSLQISNIKAGTGATNVIPANLEVDFNLRFSTEISQQDIQTRIEALLYQHQLNYELHWQLSGQPFLTPEGQLLKASRQAIKEITELDAALSTTGGTSDGRFIAPTGAEVIELGPCNASIHKANEHVKCADLDTLTKVYERTLELLLL